MKTTNGVLLAMVVLASSGCGAGAVVDVDDPLSPDYQPPGSSADAVTCGARLAIYPVRGRHNNGYDVTAGNSSQWTCDSAHSNSDFTGGRHLGNDIWAAEGTPVAATVDGTLTLTGWSDFSGNKVTIIDGCGWYHFSCHLQRIAPGIVNDKRVKAGQIIGYVGRTGTASNGVVHLHYSTYPNNNYNAGIDPFPILHAVERSTCSSTPPPPAPPSCGVRADQKLYCTNAGGAEMHSAPTFASGVVNHLRTTSSWFDCWGTGDLHPGGNRTWYHTLGDDNANWGWVAGVNLNTTSAFDANPSAQGLRKCGQ